jgi:hypothetical protein
MPAPARLSQATCEGNKDRVSVIPQCLVAELATSLTTWQAEHARQVERGGGRVQLPTALTRKYPALETAWGWQWVFPAERDFRDRVDDRHYRHHVHENTVQRVVASAAREARIVKLAS